jgi:hypothetical protein
MAADSSAVRMNYVLAMQAVSRQGLAFNRAMSDLNNLYLGAGLSGTFVDTELAGNAGTKHLTALDVGTVTANLNTLAAAFTAALTQNLAKAVGGAGGVP